jgi:hypothetical protein
MAGSRPSRWDTTPTATDVGTVDEDDGLSRAERMRARLEGWDPVGLIWRRVKVDSSGQLVTAGGGGGGGGPATIADGADVAEGATTDAAVTGDNSGTVSGKLRGLVKILTDVWDSANQRVKVDGSGVTQPVAGNVAHGSADSGNPVKVGAVYKSSPVAVTTGQRVDLLSSGYGVQKVVLSDFAGGTTSVQDADGAEGFAATHSQPVFNYGFLFNPADSKWYRVRGDSTNGQWVNVKASALPSGAATSAAQTDGTQRGSMKLLDTGGTNVAAVSAAGRLSVDASGVAVPVTDNSGSLTVDAPVGTPVAVIHSDGTAFYTGAKDSTLTAALGSASDSPGAYTALDQLARIRKALEAQLKTTQQLLAASTPAAKPVQRPTLLHGR